MEWLHLAGNQLTGCIPDGLRHVSSNDFDVLGLPFCDCSNGNAVPDPDNNLGLVSDCEALLASHDTLTGEATLNWSVDVPIADWDGITLDGTPQRVERLSLTRRGLTGEIPPDLGDLDHLQAFQASSNELTGAIPPEIGNLASLEWLILQNNQLSGEIPPELGNLTNLQVVGLHNNELTGEVPPDVGNLASLRSLFLYGNQLTGMLPHTMTQLSELRVLYFSNNDGLCAPVDDVFQTWLQSVADVSGSSCTSMESAEDRAVLIEFYDALGGDNWRDNIATGRATHPSASGMAFQLMVMDESADWTSPITN